MAAMSGRVSALLCLLAGIGLVDSKLSCQPDWRLPSKAESNHTIVFVVDQSLGIANLADVQRIFHLIACIVPAPEHRLGRIVRLEGRHVNASEYVQLTEIAEVLQKNPMVTEGAFGNITLVEQLRSVLIWNPQMQNIRHLRLIFAAEHSPRMTREFVSFVREWIKIFNAAADQSFGILHIGNASEGANSTIWTAIGTIADIPNWPKLGSDENFPLMQILTSFVTELLHVPGDEAMETTTVVSSITMTYEEEDDSSWSTSSIIIIVSLVLLLVVVVILWCCCWWSRKEENQKRSRSNYSYEPASSPISIPTVGLLAVPSPSISCTSGGSVGCDDCDDGDGCDGCEGCDGCDGCDGC